MSSVPVFIEGRIRSRGAGIIAAPAARFTNSQDFSGCGRPRGGAGRTRTNRTLKSVRPGGLVGLEPCSITLWWLLQVSERQENQTKQQNARRSAWVSDQGSWSDTNHVP